MSTAKITEAMHLRAGVDRGGNDALQSIADLPGKRLDQRVASLADGDHEHAGVRIEVVKILTNAQNPALTLHVMSKGAGDGSFLQGVLKNLPGGVAHGIGGHALVRVSGGELPSPQRFIHHRDTETATQVMERR